MMISALFGLLVLIVGSAVNSLSLSTIVYTNHTKMCKNPSFKAIRRIKSRLKIFFM